MQESEQFAATYHRLARNLGPEFHDELNDIARVATPLLQPGIELSHRFPAQPQQPESTQRALDSLDRADAAVQQAISRQPHQDDPEMPHRPTQHPARTTLSHPGSERQRLQGVCERFADHPRGPVSDDARDELATAQHQKGDT